MSTKTVNVCDRCKRQFEEDAEEVKLTSYAFTTELCGACAAKLKVFLKKPRDYDPKLLDMLDALKDAAIVSFAYDKWHFYPWRSFNETERRNLRNAMIKGPIEWAEGCAGYVDQLEMVRYESGGKTADKIKRTI